jgi:hypothetical protein
MSRRGPRHQSRSYEIVAADPEADGYDITEIIKMLKDRSQAVEFEAESPQE